MRRTLVLLCFAGIASCGAASQLETAVRSGAEFAELAEPVLVAAYRAEQQACLQKAQPEDCVGEVRARWKPVLESYDRARAAWCLLDAAVGSARCRQ